MSQKFFAEDAQKGKAITSIEERPTSVEVNNKLFEIIEVLHELISGSDLERVMSLTDRAAHRVTELMESQANALSAQKELLESASVRCDNTNSILDLEALKLNHQAMTYNMEIILTQDFQDLSGQAVKRVLSDLKILFDKLLLMNKKLGNEPIAGLCKNQEKEEVTSSSDDVETLIKEL